MVLTFTCLGLKLCRTGIRPILDAWRCEDLARLLVGVTSAMVYSKDAGTPGLLLLSSLIQCISTDRLAGEVMTRLAADIQNRSMNRSVQCCRLWEGSSECCSGSHNQSTTMHLLFQLHRLTSVKLPASNPLHSWPRHREVKGDRHIYFLSANMLARSRSCILSLNKPYGNINFKACT